MPDRPPADPRVLTTVVHRVFPTASTVTVEPATPGHRLVVVYRAIVDDAVFYLRLAEEPGQDLTTDAVILDRLKTLGASVPTVVAAEPASSPLALSYLIVTELPGLPLAEGGTDAEAHRAARAAGHDTALINSLEVTGFGWLQRTGRPSLTAELPSYNAFAVSDLPGTWPSWLAGLFAPSHLDALEALAEAERTRVVPGPAHLAHGDLDATHIYTHRGAYQGIIDFGEMRGTDQYFDLGHFLLHDAEARPVALFDSFLAGYTEFTPLPDNHRESIRHSAILLGLRQLSLWLSPQRNLSPRSRLARRRAAQLSNLLENKPPAQPRPA